MTEYKYDIESLVFPNGAQLFVLPLPESPTVAMQLAVATGSVHEAEFAGCGLSHFLEHMLFQGTKNYPGNSVSDTVSRLGGDNNAFTGYYQTVYHMTLPRERCKAGLDILSDMAVHPTFPDDKFTSEKEVICHERSMRQDKPNNLLFEELFSTVFKVHPARYPIIGYMDKIKNVSRDMMVEYYNRRYRPHLCSFVVVGPVSGAQVYRMLEKKMGEWERGSLEPSFLPVEPQQLYTRRSRAFFDDPLTRVAFGVKIPEGSNRDIPALEILSGIVGENSSSYLLRELHRNCELAVDVGSSIYPMAGEGVMFFSAAGTPKNHLKMCDKILEVLENVRTNGVTKAELEREKNQQIALTLREMRSAEDLAMQLSGSLARHFQVVSPNVRLAAYDDITIDDVNRVAATYLNSNLFSIVEVLSGKSVATVNPIKKRQEFGISSGKIGKLTTVQVPRPRVPLTEVSVIMPGGVTFENRENCGISRLISNLMVTSTKEFNEDELSEFMDDYAIEASVHCGYTSNMFSFSAPTKFQEKLFHIIKSILTEPHWTKRVFEREKTNLIEYIRTKELNPIQRAIEAGRAILYGSHPAGLPRLGDPAVIARLNADEAMNFYKSGLDADRFIVGIGGAFDKAQADGFLAELEAKINWSVNPLVLPAEPEFNHEKQHREIVLPRQQCAVACVLEACTNLSDDRFVFDILQHSENGLASRLFKLIREDNSLAYSTGMASSRGFYPGCCCFYALTTADKAEASLALLKQECQRLGSSGLSKEEFDSAQRSVALECAEQMQEPEGALRNAVLACFYHQEIMELDAQLLCYKNFTRADVNATLKRYFGDEPNISVFAGAISAVTPEKQTT